jgi:hypothetical protein
MKAADERLQSAIRIKNETWKNFLQIQRIRIFKPIWYNEDNNKYIGFSNGIYDLNYDEIEYKQELKKR